MRKNIISTLIIAIGVIVAPDIHSKELMLTPRPAKVEEGAGTFIVKATTPLVVDAPQADKIRLTEYALSHLPYYRGVTASKEKKGSIVMVVSENDGSLSDESYTLDVAPSGVKITSPGSAGLFYGLQTLIQLADGSDSLPEVHISDGPRFGYRGVMLDISRHFRDKEFIKKQIDAMARLKLNRLHLHLTDAAGWRIDIKVYPELTRYAAWRPQITWKEWIEGGSTYTEADNPLAQGGFLTQDDAREIVEYAADRYITVIPEIEMPSHSEEVTATYPHLGCFPGRQPDVCVGNEKTFEFFCDVIDEIIDVFPSEYIHIGGDEASKQAWKECEKCLSLMEREGLHNTEELQGYLINRISDYINSKGRKVIGWDEIMEGNPAPGSTIMSWRGTEGGIEAAGKGYNVIMTPGAYCYIDSYQDAPPTQPEAISGYTPLSSVYGYDPVPDSLRAAVGNCIVGLQANLWCEYIPTAQHAEYMLYPRVIAIAETGWTEQSLKDWENFYPRAVKFNDRLAGDGYYVFDIKHEVGNRREALTDIEHLGVGKKVKYNVPWWTKYNAAFEQSLVDGKRGGWSYGDRRWQGFMTNSDERLDVVVDLEKPTEISYVGADFMQIIGPDVWYPENVVISVSDDGEHFTELKNIHLSQKPTTGLSFRRFDWEGSAKGRYVRYVATAPKGCMFTDEIIIR